MKYAVVASGGKQYRVKEGDVVELDHLEVKPNSSYEFSDVLLFVDDKTKKVGTPKVAGISVKGKVISEGKGKKIRVAKYKAKVRYRKVIGFRPMYTRIQIESIAGK